MKPLRKSLLLLTLLFALKIIHSCTCPDNNHYFDFDLLTVTNLDNSGGYVRSNQTDTMFSAAVAFEVSISGNHVFAHNGAGNFSFGFSEATAMEECPIRFIPTQQINNITIRALEDISPDIPANTDVTDLFLGLIPYSSLSGYMYDPIDSLYRKINSDNYHSEPASTFHLFCKENIQNDKARFEFTVDLSDGRTLTAVTNLIHLRSGFKYFAP